MNEEQLEEICALESIYPSLLQKQTDNSFDLYLTANLSPDETDGVKLSVLFNEDYPAEAPIVSFKSFGSLNECNLDIIKILFNDAVAHSIGSPMMFDIIESIREYLVKLAEPPEVKPVEIFKKVYETYTAVSLNTFLNWKKAFDEENKELERQRNEVLKNEVFINGLTYAEVWSKPTGRALFESGFDVEEVKEDELDIAG